MLCDVGIVLRSTEWFNMLDTGTLVHMVRDKNKYCLIWSSTTGKKYVLVKNNNNYNDKRFNTSFIEIATFPRAVVHFDRLFSSMIFYNNGRKIFRVSFKL